MSYYKPTIFEQFPNVVAAESRRQGGVSPTPWESLNLGLYTDDSPENVIQNRSIFFDSLGIPVNSVVGSHQVHGKQVMIVDKPGQLEGYDALIADKPNLYLTITAADCVPILIYCPEKSAIATIHAGWRGTSIKVVLETINSLKQHFDVAPEDCFAYIGTCIDSLSYEVDADVGDHFDDAFKHWDEGRKKFFLNLKEANKSQLMEAGVPEEQIEVSPFSTFENNDLYFSYRKEKGKTGRGVAVIGMKGR